MTSNAKSISVNLTSEIVELLEQIGRDRGMSLIDVLRHAIGTEQYFHEVRKNNEKVLIEKKNGELREVIFDDE